MTQTKTKKELMREILLENDFPPRSMWETLRWCQKEGFTQLTKSDFYPARRGLIEEGFLNEDGTRTAKARKLYGSRNGEATAEAVLLPTEAQESSKLLSQIPSAKAMIKALGVGQAKALLDALAK
jgi:hypothetical protein